MPNITHEPKTAEQFDDASALQAERLRFERRVAERFETIGQVEAVRMNAANRNASGDSLIEPKMDLRLIDESITGAGFRSESPLSPGTVLEVRIGPATSPWKTGRVVRCVKMGKCFRVGVEYGRRLAA